MTFCYQLVRPSDSLLPAGREHLGGERIRFLGLKDLFSLFSLLSGGSNREVFMVKQGRAIPLSAMSGVTSECLNFRTPFLNLHCYSGKDYFPVKLTTLQYDFLTLHLHFAYILVYGVY